ncbi:general transcription factor II-I repeat domain-containing protein 2B-like [Arctopsyche grandis]|uniref:general transcription factor II-I repeat domain-containing protein 2B-like n=1 Tax=Arctopsyche grandis TaxID=121162 RepID=UPI00406D8687
MNLAFKIVNSIRGSSLQRRRFRVLLKECESDIGELLLHTYLLRRAKFLKRFLDLLPEIKEFMSTVLVSYPQLEDDKWMRNPAFLSDITGKLNELNLQLQGKNKTLTEMISDVNAFKGKLTFLEAQLRRRDLKQFENMAA